VIAAAGADVLCVCAFGALIAEPLLTEHLILNVHPSLLPRWRGAAPIERTIIAGDRATGTSIMRLSAGLDSGPVCAQERVQIAAEETYGTLAERLAELSGELLVRTLDAYPPECAEQDESLATYAAKIAREDRLLDPAQPAVELERVVRALHPHIGAQLELEDGSLLGVDQARVLEHGPPAGEISLSARWPVVGCARGALELVRVHPPGRRGMSGEEWLRGLRR